jgi:lipase maturation factor 1
MNGKAAEIIAWLFDSEGGASDRLIPRWLFLRALGVIYFSAFFSLLFQIRGLLGPSGILPAKDYLEAVTHAAGNLRYWYAPTLLWLNSGSHMLMGLCWVGLIASVLLLANIWPRGALAICFVCFLSFAGAASEFAGYQSDGMLLEAGFISLFLAPPGFRPGLARSHPPIRASVFLLLWEWFRIYFESGVAKIASGDPQWRHLTAMDEYYQNGPLPTWIGWYVQHLPHWFHAATAFGTLMLELVLVWLLFLGRRGRIICFLIVTPWQIGVILTANYAFLNYLVLALGIFLLDDRFLLQYVPARWRGKLTMRLAALPLTSTGAAPAFESRSILQPEQTDATEAGEIRQNAHRAEWTRWRRQFHSLKLAAIAIVFLWLFYASTVELVWMIVPGFPLPSSPVVALEPFRIAERYGLFAVMTPARYEIEFQGSNDGGKTWTPYPFRFKPQDVLKPPRIFAPYHPRFDWNLWFASLGDWRSNPIVPRTEKHLLNGDKDALSLFAGNPFPDKPPRRVRALLWQYWFTSVKEKRETGAWWKRESRGLYAPTLEIEPDGKLGVVDFPSTAEPPEAEPAPLQELPPPPEEPQK